MKGFKYIFGIFAAAFGFLCICGCLNLLSRSDRDISTWVIMLMLCIFGLGPIAAGFLFLRPFIKVPVPACPNCGRLACQQVTILRKSPMFRIWFFGWLGLLYSVWLGGKSKKMLCESCDITFFADSRGAAIARIFFWLVATCVVFCILLVWLMSYIRHA